jgi:hypothetical protein
MLRAAKNIVAGSDKILLRATKYSKGVAGNDNQKFETLLRATS